MSMRKTLGGDRLGAGKKMQVDLHGYQRSTHDLSYIWRSTTSAGTLVPFMSQLCLPGDTWDIDLQCEVLTHPTIGPLFGSFKVQLDIFEAPIRLYNSWLHNNKLNVGRDISQVKIPQVGLETSYVDTAIDIDNAQINPSCIFSYLGIRGVGPGPEIGEQTIRHFNAVPWLAYWEIFKNYYANKQEDYAYVIHTPVEELITTIDTIKIGGTNFDQEPTLTFIGMGQNSQIVIDYTGATPLLEQIMINTQYNGRQSLRAFTTLVDQNTPGTITATYNFTRYGADVWKNWGYRTASEIATPEPALQAFELTEIDKMRESILSEPGNVPFNIEKDIDIAPYTYALQQNQGVGQSMLNSQEGLAVKTYQSDLFNNWVNTDWIDGPGGINEITKVSTVGDAFTIDALQLARKVYDMLNRVAVSGGSYNDWVEVMYDHRPFVVAESPMYHGGLSKELIFQEVVSNAQAGTAESGSQPLGTLAGRGKLSGKHKGGKAVIKPGEPGYIIGIFSLTPRIDYSQGNSWDMHLKTLGDIHVPGLDQIGFQDLIREQKAWWDTTLGGGVFTQKASGKQPAWVNYMTNVNKVYGNFAIKDDQMWMTLNRRYEGSTNEGGITDDTTYIDPTKFNFIFAETALDAQNFWVQIGVNIECRRKMSAKLMPNL